MKKAYQSKLPSISNNRDFANLLAEMTGELNASHIGVTYRPSPTKNGDRTAALGVLFDLSDTTGPLEIVEILDKSPLKQAKSSIKPGMKLTAVDGVVLDGKTNLAQLLNHKTANAFDLVFSVLMAQSLTKSQSRFQLEPKGNCSMKDG